MANEHRDDDSAHLDDIRVDPHLGTIVHIVGARQGRPNLPSTGCPFCPGGLEAPEPYDVRWFRNRWPAMPGDRCEVVLYTSEHDATFFSLGVAGVRKVIDLWASRTEHLGARDDVDYVLVFENRGPEVGATIAHPHGQIYAYDRVPPRAQVELDRGDAPTSASLGPDPPGDRLVSRDGAWRAWVPWAATWPYEMVVAPDRPVPDLPALDDRARDELGAVLVDPLGRPHRPSGEPMPYMLWFHQRPTDGGAWPTAWLHAHIVPIHRSAGTPRFVAAAELGGQVYFNPVDPDDAAQAL